MMKEIFELVGKIRVDMSGLDKAFNKVESQTKKIGQNFTNVGQSMSSFGGSMTAKVTAPIMAAGAAAVKIGMDFEQSMSKVEAMTEATDTQMKELEKTARDLGKSTQFSAKEAADGMSFLAMAGFKTNEIIQAMPAMLDLAAAGQLDLASAADIASNVLSGFGMEASESGHMADVLAKAATNANTNVYQLGEAMKFLAPAATALGWEVEESTAAVMAFSDAGIQGSMAGQAFASSLQRLSRPSDRMQDSMDALGLKFFDAEGNMKPLVQIIREMENAMADMTKEEKAMHTTSIFGAEAFKHWSVLLERGADDLENMEQSLIDSNGAAAAMAKTMNDNLRGDMLKMISAAQEMALVFYEAVAPSLREGVKWLTKVFEKLADLSPETQRLILKVIALAAVIGPIILILGKFAMAIGSIISLAGTFIGIFGKITSVILGFGKVVGSSVGMFAKVGGAIARFLPIIGRLASIGRLLHPVGLAITGIILLFKGLLKYFDMTPKNIIDGLVLGFKKGIPLLWEAAKEMGMAIINKFKEILGIQSPSTVFYDFGVWIIEGLINGIKAMVQFVIDLFVQLVEMITDIIVNFVTWLINKITELKDKVIEKVTEMVTGVIRKFREMVEGAIQAGKDIVNAIVGAFQDAWNGAKEFVNKAASLGVDFAKGIANGITSGAKWIKDAVIGIGKQAVKAFKNFFDIQSPSRVMAAEAKWIPEGIAKGITDGSKKAVNSIGRVGQRIGERYKRINENTKKQAKQLNKNIRRYYDQATGFMRNVKPLQRIANVGQPRRVAVSSPVISNTGRKGNLGQTGNVNVNVRRLENASNKTIQNKVERRFFSKARQRE